MRSMKMVQFETKETKLFQNIIKGHLLTIPKFPWTGEQIFIMK